MRLQTHYSTHTMSTDRCSRRSTRQKDGGVSDTQSSYTRQPQLALLLFLSVSRRSGPRSSIRWQPELCTELQHAAAAIANKKGTHAQGNPPPSHHQSSPPPCHSSVERLSRRRGPRRHAPSCTKVERCCAAMRHKPGCFLALFPSAYTVFVGVLDQPQR